MILNQLIKLKIVYQYPMKMIIQDQLQNLLNQKLKKIKVLNLILQNLNK